MEREGTGWWASLEQRGQTAKAIAEYKAGLDQNPKELRTLCALSHTYGLSGDSGRAFATAARFIDLKQTEIKRATLSYCAALLYTSLGRKDSAFEWLERARVGGTVPRRSSITIRVLSR